jgi:hypothetical protein
MRTKPLFLSLDSSCLAREISLAERSVCYAAPGILREPAEALAALSRAFGPELITVCLDFDERVIRMDFGTLDAVKTLREAGIEVRSTPGLRTGLVIIDDTGYIFTPTSLYLEADERSAQAALIQKMQLDVTYKDVTFETLNQDKFLDSVKAAFPGIDWDKTYKEFRAVGEKEA